MPDTPEVVRVARMLIHCPSITPDTAGVYDIIEAFLIPHGFRTQRVTFTDPAEAPVENLYMRFGLHEPNFCFAGHTDVVPPGDEKAWRFPPFSPQEVDGELYGRGAEDMKGAIAAFLIAARNVIVNWEKGARSVSEPLEGDSEAKGGLAPPSGAQAPHKKFPGSISLLITQDEEGLAINGTKKLLPYLKERGEELSHCLVGEPTNPDHVGEMIKVGRRGSAYFTLTVRGKQGHVAYPERADNPVPRLVAMLHALETTPIDKGSKFFPPSNLEITTVDVGNPTGNVIPAVAVAKFNVRFSDKQTGASIEAWVKKQLAPLGDHELVVRVTGESFLTSDMAFAKQVAAAVEEATGMKPEFSTTGGTSDARFIKDYCPVAEFGATNRTAHMVDESVAIESLEKLVLCYQRLLERYFGL